MPEQEAGMDTDGRRRFLNLILGSGVLAFLGSALYPILRFVIPPAQSEAVQSSVVAALVDELAPNEGKTFRFGSRPGLLVRLATGDYKAYSAVCPHLNCTVQYRSDLSQIWCACHNGMFNLNGEVLSGPPPSPLDTYEVAVRGNEIVVSRG